MYCVSSRAGSGEGRQGRAAAGRQLRHYPCSFASSHHAVYGRTMKNGLGLSYWGTLPLGIIVSLLIGAGGSSDTLNVFNVFTDD